MRRLDTKDDRAEVYAVVLTIEEEEVRKKATGGCADKKEGAWTKDDLASVAGSAVFEGGGWREVSATKDRGEWRRLTRPLMREAEPAVYHVQSVPRYCWLF